MAQDGRWKVYIRDDIDVADCRVTFDGEGKLTITTPNTTRPEVVDKMKLLPCSAEEAFRVRIERPPVVEATFHACRLTNTAPVGSYSPESGVSIQSPPPMVFAFIYRTS